MTKYNLSWYMVMGRSRDCQAVPFITYQMTFTYAIRFLPSCLLSATRGALSSAYRPKLRVGVFDMDENSLTLINRG